MVDKGRLMAVVLGIVFVLCGLALGWIAIRDAFFKKEEPKPQLTEAIPRDASLCLPSVPLGTDRESFIIPYGHSSEIKILFDAHSSVGGIWKGSNPKFVVMSPYKANIAAETDNTGWGATVRGRELGSEQFSPWLTIALPVEAKYLHEWIYANASLEIVFPALTGLQTFENRTSFVSRRIGFFVVSPEEFLLVEQHKKMEKESRENKNSIVILAICSVGVLFVGIVYIMASLERDR